ncbi:hypothetical protein AB0G06_22785 [Nonomuraea dietziae]|uniref:hypothetical protein n=1 Tax=Nonomuraea dietziae TaxID=65515 RepID=UPI003403F78B
MAMLRWLVDEPMPSRSSKPGAPVRYRSEGTANAIMGTIGEFLSWCSLQGWVPPTVVNTLTQPKFLRYILGCWAAGTKGRMCTSGGGSTPTARSPRPGSPGRSRWTRSRSVDAKHENTRLPFALLLKYQCVGFLHDEALIVERCRSQPAGWNGWATGRQPVIHDCS